LKGDLAKQEQPYYPGSKGLLQHHQQQPNRSLAAIQ
jgi:hypothetical protein